jgi:hypothetical protein
MRRAVSSLRVVLLLSTLVLVPTACGAEETPAEKGTPTSVRIESVTRMSIGPESVIRANEIVDYERDRWLSEDVQTGCRSVAIGHVFYNELPAASELPEGKHWVRYDRAGYLSDPDSEAAFERTIAEDEKQSTDNVSVHSIVAFGEEEPSPGRYLDGLREKGMKVQLVSDEDLRGERTTHYRANLDVRQDTRRALEAAGWKPANVERYLGQVPAGEQDIDVWVGLDGLERRVVTTTRYTDTLSDEGEIVVTGDYLDYGLEPRIEAPPAAEVVDADEFMQLVEEHMKDPQAGAPRPAQSCQR